MLSCYDRLAITGTLPVVCYAAGMTGYLKANGIRILVDFHPSCKTAAADGRFLVGATRA